MWIRVVRQVSVLRRVFGHLDKVSILTRNLNECRQKPTNKAAYFFPKLVVRIQEAGCGLGVSTHACKWKPGDHAPWLTGTGSLAEQRLTWCPGAQDQEICLAGSSAVLLIKQQKNVKR